ncbi:aminoglycoside N(6')-acetyltransferase [Polycladomyces abyssicola]|uniref:Aminoglycoside N(6')-acetyltransferase n=1 Tax=Polycladomyces abyssicola TaxID=1125966 RepID=A0A8D5UF44_9BACL|nr:GNAT family protein [Polycladomyces abyssicola]BCU80845.1 aminoglycoside N(6')-acetyltransferase [Polycladomyces abyssicola]
MITLQPFTKEDYTQLIEWVNSPALLLQWGGPRFTFPLDERQLDDYLSWHSPGRQVWKAVETASGRTVGHIELGNIDSKNRIGTITRVMISPDVRGRGWGERIMREAVRYGFETLQLHRIELRVFDFNHAAIRCYEKVGFQKEGLLRQCRRFGDEYWSLWIMSLLRPEWLKQKQEGGECKTTVDR